MSKYNTINLALYGLPPVCVEKTAEVSIKPGMFCRILPNGNIIPDDGPSGPSTNYPDPKLVAVENIYFGKGAVEPWSEGSADYAAGDIVLCNHLRPGDKIWAWLAPGGATVADEGSPARARGNAQGFDGTVIADDNFRDTVGYFDETIDNTAGLEPVRIVVVIS